MEEWIIRHPYAVGAFFVAVASAGLFNIYRAGLAVGEMRALAGEVDKLASEMLGG